MNTKDYIESGILELYVYGALDATESQEVTATLRQYPELKTEVEEIETSLNKLSTAVAPYNPEALISQIKEKLSFKGGKVVSLQSRRSSNMPAIIGWAASIALLGGLFYMLNENSSLRENLQSQQAQNVVVQDKFEKTEQGLTETKSLLDIVRKPDIVKVPLNAQAVNKEAYAAVYWNTETNEAYIDAKGLPTPPQGKVYQVWSLKLAPLTPTSIGLLENLETNDNLMFKLPNANASEAFGITLEPAGGSESPTLEQLYVLGAVGS